MEKESRCSGRLSAYRAEVRPFLLALDQCFFHYFTLDFILERAFTEQRGRKEESDRVSLEIKFLRKSVLLQINQNFISK